MIKIAFFDFDGTFYSHKTHRVPKSNIETIKKLQEKGILCVMATGRSMEELVLFHECDDIPFDGYIMNAGMGVYNSKREIEYTNDFIKEDIQPLLDIFKNKELSMILMTEKGMYVNFVDDKITKALEYISSKPAEVGTYEGERIYQIAGFFDQQQEIELRKRLHGIKITRWHEYGVDLTCQYINKATTIQQYLKNRNISLEEAICFGDGINDVEMFQECGISVCMKDGIDEVKKLASYVTDNVDDDGIYKACEKLGLF